jgi:hypothetical protein
VSDPPHAPRKSEHIPTATVAKQHKSPFFRPEFKRMETCINGLPMAKQGVKMP